MGMTQGVMDVSHSAFPQVTFISANGFMFHGSFPLILMTDPQKKNSFLIASRVTPITMKRYIKLAIQYVDKGIPKYWVLVASIVSDNQFKSQSKIYPLAAWILLFPSDKWQGLSLSSWRKNSNMDLIWRHLLFLHLSPAPSVLSAQHCTSGLINCIPSSGWHTVFWKWNQICHK